jgi:hypothetical protein
MPGTPTLGVSIDFANNPGFGNPLLLDDPSTPLGIGILADSPADVVDVSDIALRVSIRRGRNRVLNSFEAGTATVVLEDENGDYNPKIVHRPTSANFYLCERFASLQIMTMAVALTATIFSQATSQVLTTHSSSA